MTIQELQFELIKRASFNGFDGERVVSSLLEHKDLWRGVVMDTASYCSHNEFGQEPEEKINLTKLLNIENNLWSVDTLYILPQTGKEKELVELAETWEADEVSYGQYHLGIPNAPEVLRVWWD
jgi:hypothetical protein